MHININRTQRITLRLSEAECRGITRKAKSCGLSKSAYIRQLIVGYEPRESPPADYFALSRELKEIGNNLNRALVRAIANPTWQSGSKTLILRVIH